MALPLAPQFVAFDRGMTASDSNQVHSAAISQPSFQISGSTTAIIPATLRMRESSSLGVISEMTAVKVAAKVVDARVDADHFAGRKLAPARDLLVEASASAEPEVVPQFQTLVFIEATQYGTADSPVWQVQVWRVTLVTQVRERLARVPVANSI